MMLVPGLTCRMKPVSHEVHADHFGLLACVAPTDKMYGQVPGKLGLKIPDVPLL